MEGDKKREEMMTMGTVIEIGREWIRNRMEEGKRWKTMGEEDSWRGGRDILINQED